MKKWFTFLFLFLSHSLAAAPYFIQNVNIAIKKGKMVEMTVRLSSPSELQVFFDTQKPANTEKLFQFWFNQNSPGKKKVHKILLKRVDGARMLYFRFKKKTGVTMISRLYHWQKNRLITVR